MTTTVPEAEAYSVFNICDNKSTIYISYAIKTMARLLQLTLKHGKVHYTHIESHTLSYCKCVDIVRKVLQ